MLVRAKNRVFFSLRGRKFIRITQSNIQPTEQSCFLIVFWEIKGSGLGPANIHPKVKQKVQGRSEELMNTVNVDGVVLFCFSQRCSMCIGVIAGP